MVILEHAPGTSSSFSGGAGRRCADPKLITDGCPSLAPSWPAREGTGIRPAATGIGGGTPEGVIAACAVKCLGGIIRSRLAPRDDDERDRPPQ